MLSPESVDKISLGSDRFYDLGGLEGWEKSEPYIVTDVPPGEHQLKVELVNNDHSEREPAIEQWSAFAPRPP